MTTWDAVALALSAGVNQILPMFQSTETLRDAGTILKTALITYPDPAVRVVATALLIGVIAAFAGWATDNYSWIDKCWSLVPAYYAWVIAFKKPGSEMHPRLLQMAAIISLWAIRLTYNFERKGGYKWSGEDYRWPIIKRAVHPILFQIFNFVFIGITQSLLLASLVSPAYVAWHSPTPFGGLDILAALMTSTFLIMEAVADEQQWDFQNKKRAAIASGEPLTGDLARGFITTGLFRYTRHPNFFAEQAFWWSMCLYGSAATGQGLGWWYGGAAALTALFQGSTWLTEKISASKYPAYALYQRSTSRLVPWFPAAELPDDEYLAAEVQEEEAAARTPAAAKVSTPASASRGRSRSTGRKSTDGKPAPSRARSTSTGAAKPRRGRVSTAATAAAAEPAAETAAPARSRGRSTSTKAPARRRSTKAAVTAEAAPAAPAAAAPSRGRSTSKGRSASKARSTSTAKTKTATSSGGEVTRRTTRARRS